MQPADGQDSDSPGLGGRRVVVTRAVSYAKPLIEAIELHGGVSIALPLLQIVDIPGIENAIVELLRSLTARDWLIVLSPNGARRVLAASPEGELRCQIAAIGRGTAAVLTEAGSPVDLIPDVASSVGLLAALKEHDVSGRVIIAQAEGGLSTLVDGLLERGVEATALAVYRNILPAIDADAAKQALAATDVVFASPSAVVRYVEHIGEQPTRAVCIGEVTASEARSHGFDVTVAHSPTVEALLTALQAGR